jgi:hypothetical protein
MKKLIIAVSYVFLLINVYSQNPYYDALKLAGYLEAGKFIIPGRTADSIIQKEKMKEYCDLINTYYNHKFKTCKEVHQGVGSYRIGGSLNPDFNPFIGPYLSPGSVQSKDASVNLGAGFSSAMSSIGGLDVTTIVYGLADFLVKRTQEELNVAFFSKFKETLNSPKYRDLKTLFPNTWGLLDAIGDEIYDYNKYLQNLREAFQSDIMMLDVNLPGIIPNHQAFFNNHFEFAVSLNTACYITTSLKNQVHPGDIIDEYPLDKFFIKEGQSEYFNKNWSGAIQTLQLISGSLRDTSTKDENYWVSFEQVKELINNKNAFKIYLGLIYQVAKSERYNSIPFKEGSFVALLDLVDVVNFDKDYLAYKSYISNFALKVNDLNEMVKKYSKPANDSLAFEIYARYLKSSVEMIEYCTKVTSLPHFDKIIKINLHEDLKNYFKITYETSDLAIDINRANYSSAINHAVSIYNLIRTTPLEKEYHDISQSGGSKGRAAKKGTTEEKEKKAEFKAEKEYNKAIDKYLKKVYDTALSESVTFKVVLSVDTNSLANKPAMTDALLKEYEGEIAKLRYPIEKSAMEDSLKLSKNALQKLVRYGTFMATIVTAKNSDDVEKAIEAAALPSGSSRIKRETPFNVSLNAYCGLFVGHEKIVGLNDKHMINNYGVTAPIGVSISTGGHSFAFAWPSHEGHWSYSAFISLIDIGAVASFRFQNTDSVSQVPTIQLQDIFSPGLFFSIGIPKCPLSLNLGAQVGPNLRKVYIEDPNNPSEYINGYQNNVYWRFSASLVVDIPIFNFYTKSKN